MRECGPQFGAQLLTQGNRFDDLDFVAPSEQMPCQFEHAAGAKAHDDAAFGMRLDCLARMKTVVLEVLHPARKDMQRDILLFTLEVGERRVGERDKVEVSGR